MAPNEIICDVSKHVKDVTLTVNVKAYFSKWFRFRLWLGCLFINFGCWIIGFKYVVIEDPIEDKIES